MDNFSIFVVAEFLLIMEMISFASASDTKIVAVGSTAIFNCNSVESPMWIRQTLMQKVTEGMAIGDKKKSRFREPR